MRLSSSGTLLSMLFSDLVTTRSSLLSSRNEIKPVSADTLITVL